jgi:glycosyltransferase involved in cell wall biosynthesis
METPLFSVVIPAYNQAEYLPATVQSILNQTFDSFEILIVNDASPDNTSEVVRQMTDPRIRLLIHEQNKGLPGARNTGMQAARGSYVALLDSDDLFHPQKLERHAAFLDAHPEVDVTYNPRYELNYSDTTIRELVRPPLTVGLRDFLYGYPFTPSDMVLRKAVIDRVGGFDERFRAGGEDMEYPATLALAGCQFASVDRGLNYRRHHSGRYRKNLDARLKDVQDALAHTYANPRCPAEIRQLGEAPLSEHTIVLIYLAFIQERTADGQRFFEYLLQINPQALQGQPCAVSEYFANNSAADEKDDHEQILRRLFAQLPPAAAHIANQLDWAIQQAYLVKGVRAILWERQQAGEQHFANARQVGARFSEKYLQKVTQHLINYEVEMGSDALKIVQSRLLPHIQALCHPAVLRRFRGELAARRAFENYQRRQFGAVPANVLEAMRNEPRFLTNRGLFAICARALLKK